MSQKPTSATSDRPTLSRRGALKAGGALLGVALAGVGQAAAASPTRESYTIADGTEYETTVHVYDSNVSGITTFVVGGMHGDEPSGYKAAEHISNWSVKTGRLVVISQANVPAIEDGDRHNGFDLNRQFPPRSGDCNVDIAQAIWDEVERHDPDLVFDLHSSKGIYRGSPDGVGQAMFPTWTDPARDVAGRVVNKINDRFDLSGDIAYRVGNTLDADNPMLVHRVAGILDRPGYILETYRGPSLDQQVGCHLWAVRWGMEEFGQYRGTPEETSSGSSTDSTSDSSAEEILFEANEISITDSWREYSLDKHYRHPCIVAPSMRHRGWHQSHVRVDDNTNGSYKAQVEEWEYLDGGHVEESAGVVAVQSGRHTTQDGRPLEAGRTHVDEDWSQIGFRRGFGESPVVFAHPRTCDRRDPVVARVRSIGRYGFYARLQEEESNDGNHSDELLAWFAVEPGRGVINGRQFEAGVLDDAVDEDWHTIEFDGSYDNPVFIANMTSHGGRDPSTVRYDDLSSSSVDVFVEEEQSVTRETGHINEDVGYFVMEG